MSLRRTALQRKSQLRRTPLPRGTVVLGRRAVAASTRRPRPTGPTQDVRMIIINRADTCCERCGIRLASAMQRALGYSIHHRRPRGMGGTSRTDANSPANLLLLCGSGTTGCHGWVEANREAALEQGFLVRQGDDPAAVPVAVWATAPHSRALLTCDGDYQEVPRG